MSGWVESMNRKYLRGRDKEYEAISALKALGYNTFRMASSKGVFDVIAISSTDVRVVQVKSVKTIYSSFKQDIKQIRAFKAPKYVQKELWIWYSPNKDRKKRGWDRIIIE